ncbi:AraC family transcriptional regulator [Botryobacter ruber]|uniref:AraC family transcriptional regulator n=1 Tax=Botryobacter ruber TaxID=2171629 RepID=UPI000E0AAC6F|nr:AraC family transcriptional regulator [Botryobacter ruber]
MKPFLIKVDVAPEQSFKVRDNVNPLYYNQWHYHDELELTFIKQGTGIRFVGDSIENFQAGDLILIGSNLPHFWRSDEAASKDETESSCQALVVQFKAGFWGNTFLELPELGAVKELFAKAGRGIRITGTARRQVSNLMADLTNATGLDRLLLLLQTLKTIAATEEVAYLSSAGFNSSLNEAETKRMSAIYSYTLAHFSRKINLDEVASVASLTPNAFCRYFKTHTRKTYTQFLQEIRVGHACKLLMQNNLSIGQVCLDSGFQNVSNFNRCFKSITQLTPLEYQKLHRKSG